VLLVFEPGVAGSVFERPFAVEAGGCTPGGAAMACAAPRGGHQHAQPQPRHHADHDPEEEQCASRWQPNTDKFPVSRWAARPALLNTPAIATIPATSKNQSNDDASNASHLVVARTISTSNARRCRPMRAGEPFFIT